MSPIIIRASRLPSDFQTKVIHGPMHACACACKESYATHSDTRREINGGRRSGNKLATQHGRTHMALSVAELVLKRKVNELTDLAPSRSRWLLDTVCYS